MSPAITADFDGRLIIAPTHVELKILIKNTLLQQLDFSDNGELFGFAVNGIYYSDNR